MDLDKIENAIEEMAEDVDVSVDEIRALICGGLEKKKVAGPKLHGLGSLKAREAFMIKRILMKAALRAYEQKQKEDKKNIRKSSDWRSSYQQRIAYRAWDITTLLRKYAELRGKNPDAHSLDKWAGQERY